MGHSFSDMLMLASFTTILASVFVSSQAFSIAPQSLNSLYAAPVSGDEYDNAAQYELIELSPEEVEELLSEIHTPSVDHLLHPSDYIDVEEAEDDVPAADYHLSDYYQDDEEEEQIEQLKQLEHLLEERGQSKEQTSTTTTPATPATTTTTARPVLRRMTKERRGMVEEPIFRPGNANDPQFMYRGRKKRSAPIPPFVQSPTKY